MVRRILVWLFVATVAVLVSAIFLKKGQIPNNLTHTQEYKRDNPVMIRGSIPYWEQEKAFLSFSQNAGKFDYISLYWYYLGPDGQVKKYRGAREDQNIIKFAHDNNVKVGAIITNLLDDEDLGWNSPRVEAWIKNDSAIETHVNSIGEKLKSAGFDGVILDYELVNKNQKENFSKFVKVLSEKMHKDGKFVTVVLHPKTGQNKKGEEIGQFQDWKEIAKYADQLSIMGYSEHGDEDEAGPIASVGWVDSIVNYALSLKIPREKLFLGIPLYGYRWQVDSDENAEGLTFSQIQKIIAANQIEVKWDETFKSPYFEYEKDGEEYIVWFENAGSVSEKMTLADKKGLGGVNFWRLGDEDPKIWDQLAKVVRR